MPYVNDSVREEVRTNLEALILDLRASIPNLQRAGAVNYCFSKLLYELYPEPTYSDYNTMIGILECAKLELYRAQAGPYEDQKIKQNGKI